MSDGRLFCMGALVGYSMMRVVSFVVGEPPRDGGAGYLQLMFLAGALPVALRELLK